jgi:hypothetical protein
MTKPLDILGWSYVKTARQIWKFSAVPKQTDSFALLLKLLQHLEVSHFIFMC